MPARHLLRNDIGPLAYRRGLSDDAVARAAGLSRSHVNRIKNRAVVPRVDTALAIAKALGFPLRRVFHIE